MTKKSPSKKALVKALLDRHGQTYSDELGIGVARGTPSPLFRWLCASILFSARISANLAASAARALADAGWTTPKKMAASTWGERVKVLNRSGYARYDESTSRMLGEDVDILMSEYGGDLRKLRERAGREPKQERELLKAFKGIGDVGCDVFMREAQAAWDELYPFADKRALDAGKQLGLGSDAKALSTLVPREDFPRLVAALVRTSFAKDYDKIREAAA